jgi:predicted RNase H-like HicB family nuclease
MFTDPQADTFGSEAPNMLIAYIAKALEHATFEGPEDGRWYGEILACPGVWATGESKEECRRELQEVLEGWLILKLRDNDPDIPTIDGISLDVVEGKEGCLNAVGSDRIQRVPA